MNNKLPSAYVSVLKREFWEHRGAFVILPAGLAALLIITMIIGLLIVDNYNIEMITGELDGDFFSQHDNGETAGEDSDRHYIIRFDEGKATVVTENDEEFSKQFSGHNNSLNAGLYGIHSVFMTVAWIVALFYLLGSLYTDRKDRSILFWKSMPISETKTIVTKLLVGILAVPLVATLASWVTQLLYVVGSLIFVSIMNQDPWTTIWPNLDIFEAFVGQVLLSFVILLWVLPFCAWLMAASAFAKRSPFLVAFLPIVGIILFELFIFQTSYFGDLVFNHFPVNDRYEGFINGDVSILQLLNYPNILSGAVVAVGLLAATVWLRNNRFEI